MRKGFLVLVASLVLAFAASPAQADVIQFNPAGTGLPGGSCVAPCINIDLFDVQPGNSLSTGLNATSPAGTIGTLLFQANLGLTSLNGLANYLNGSVAGNFFTVTAILTEQITSNVAGTLEFGFAPGPNTFEIWRHTVPGDNLAGTCFRADCAGATLILTGTFVNDAVFFGSFTGNQIDSGPLDQFNANNYPATNSVSGTGSFQANVNVSFANPLFFPGLDPDFTFIFAASAQSLPYGNVDPSALFFGAVPGVASVGAVNGLGANTMLETDARFSFNVPEPTTLGLLSLGLFGATAIRRRQLRKKAE